MNENVLRQIIRQELKALAEGKMLKTREGERIEYASEQHINELERDLDELILMRNGRKPTTRERYVLQKAVEHVRTSLRRAQRARDTAAKLKAAAETDLLVDGES